MAKSTPKGTIIIAGPGAGKTHNMVAKIIDTLPHLAPARYLAVITYTNSATNNILSRLSKKIIIPENLFVGTIHSFLNRFVIIPFSSLMHEPVGREKLFMQCGLEDVFMHVESLKEKENRSKTPEEKAIIKAKIKKKLNSLGYITFDQTLSVSEQCLNNHAICKVIANRLQYLFVDEFQDSGNTVFNIIEAIRKQGKTKIYCVGDPEQYIQSFDSTIRSFSNIPILKAVNSKGYNVEINNSNYRCAFPIVAFLNQFNGRVFGNTKFSQIALSKLTSTPVTNTQQCIFFINGNQVVKPIIDIFYSICEQNSITEKNRCIIAKRKEVISRITAALSNNYRDPKKSSTSSPIKAIQEALLTTLQLSVNQFCHKYNTTVNSLRKHAIAIHKAIKTGEIKDENSFGRFVTDTLQLPMKTGLPVKVDNLRFDVGQESSEEKVTVATIHTIKGLESGAVLVIAKTKEELLLWLETDRVVRDAKRTNETTDYPRLGYVAFSRAEKLLCISCLENIGTETATKLTDLGIEIHSINDQLK